MEGHSRLMALKSSTVRVCESSPPWRTPPVCICPGMIISALVPSELILADTEADTPSPMLSMVMTDATPIIIPSMVRMVRILLLFKAFRAILTVARKLIGPPHHRAIVPALLPRSDGSPREDHL